MKSLKESLFDDNITKDMTFGDLFEFESYNIQKVFNTIGRNVYDDGHERDLSKTFSLPRIKKAAKVSGSDNNEIIYKGLVKIIQDIKLKGDPEDLDKKWMEDTLRKEINGLFQYSLTMKSLYVGFFNYGHLCLGKEYTLFDRGFDEVQIGLGPDLLVRFKRK